MVLVVRVVCGNLV
ncbi:hypothetical protein M2G69_21680 [Vibrio vulnificus]|nr:hypothetical protein [Vibrio vulnificus]MCU8435047.1 hypothetical protein [Vibrio vulnificus]MCU8518827.1 hypothetical protein [Vibrio vulnificus]MCU8562300.1 hypothetical protein [Vibrio vulnificus]